MYQILKWFDTPVLWNILYNTAFPVSKTLISVSSFYPLTVGLSGEGVFDYSHTFIKILFRLICFTLHCHIDTVKHCDHGSI